MDHYLLHIMPGARAHLKIEMTLLAASTIGVAILKCEGMIHWRDGAVFLFAYLFSSLFLSPDLDLLQSRASRRWGIGRILWFPYAKIFPHRRLSHHLLFGPLTRILYLGAIVLVISWGIELITGRSLHLFLPVRPILVPVLCGLYLPNQIHIVVDRLWSFLKTA